MFLPAKMPDEKLNERIHQIEGLIRKTEALPDPKVRALALELCQAVLGFHAAALERMIEIISQAGESCGALVNTLAADDLTSSLLLLHGLHPHSLEERAASAIEKVRPFLRSRGATVRLTGVEGGVVSVRVEGVRAGSTAPVQAAVEEAVYAMAPEAIGVVVEGLEQPAVSGFVPLASLYPV
jgi:Fe-S cluster biogenesis protein NfuA